jgi:hypothetical protein
MCCLEFPVFEKIFLVFVECLFHIHKKFHDGDIKSSLLAVKICFPQQFYIFLGPVLNKPSSQVFSDDTSTPKLFAIFCNANIPLSKLSSESAIITRSSALKIVFTCVMA